MAFRLEFVCQGYESQAVIFQEQQPSQNALRLAFPFDLAIGGPLSLLTVDNDFV
jgi:hypothetical protein